MIHASNLCFLFQHCQWLMRANCRSSQREALLEGERRIREGVSKVGFTVQKLFFPLLVCLWLSKVTSVRAWCDFQKSELLGLSIPVAPTAQDLSGMAAHLSSTEPSLRPHFWVSSLLWGRGRTFLCSLKMVSAKLPGHSSPEAQKSFYLQIKALCTSCFQRRATLGTWKILEANTYFPALASEFHCTLLFLV